MVCMNLYSNFYAAGVTPDHLVACQQPASMLVSHYCKMKVACYDNVNIYFKNHNIMKQYMKITKTLLNIEPWKCTLVKTARKGPSPRQKFVQRYIRTNDLTDYFRLLQVLKYFCKIFGVNESLLSINRK